MCPQISKEHASVEKTAQGYNFNMLLVLMLRRM